MADRAFKLTFIGDAKSALASMKATEGGMARMANVAKLAAVGGIALAGKAMFDMGQDFEAATDTIQAGTGATGKALDDLNDSFKNVLVGVPQSMDEVSQALADVNTETGLVGEALETTTRHALDATRVFGGEAGALVKGVTDALTQFSRPQEDFIGMLDLIAKTSQDTGVTVDKITADTAKFGSVWKNAGFSLEETTQLLAAFEGAGLQTSRVMPGLNAAFRKAADEGVTDMVAQFETWQMLIGEAETDTEALTIATKIFGSEGAQRMTVAIRSGIIPSHREMQEAMKDSEGAVATIGEEALTLGEKFDRFKNIMKVELAPAAEKFFDVIEKIVDVIVKAPPGLVALVAGFAALAVVVALLISVLAPLAILFSPAGLIILGIVAVIAAGVLLWKNWDTVKEKAGELANFIMEKLGALVGWIKDRVLDVITNDFVQFALLFTPLGPLAAFFLFKDHVINAFEGVWAFVKAVIDGIIRSIEDLIGAVRRVKNELTSLPGEAAGAVNSAVRSVPVVGGVLNAAGAVGGFGLDLGGGLAGGIGGLFNDLGGVVGGPRGQPQLVVAHGGETIVPTHRNSRGGGTTVHINMQSFIGNADSLQRVVTQAIEDARQRGADF